MWIGFGALALFDLLKDYIKPKMAMPAAFVVCLFASPILLAKENWDDHDRSGRKTALAMARKYLDSVDENAILFTIGDNDTFALWYIQEIEGYRTDVRVVNTSLINTDWYMDQMKRKAYKSDPVPSQLTHEKYRYGTRDFAFYKPVRDTMSLDLWMDWLSSDDPRTKEELRSGEMAATFPSKNIVIPVKKDQVIANGIVPAKDSDQIVDEMTLSLSGDIIYKNRMLMLDMVSNNNWERPIYFTGGSFGDDDYLWMKEYLQLDGVCFKLVPIKTAIDPDNPYDMGRIDTEKSYEIIKNWYWGNSGSPDIYHDRETRTNAITYRGNIARVVEQLLKEGKQEKAKVLMDIAMEKMPIDIFEFYTLVEPYVSGYYSVGEIDRAREIWAQLASKYQEQLTYFSNLSEERQYKNGEEIWINIEKYRALVDLLVINDDKDLLDEKIDEFNNYSTYFCKMVVS